MSVSAWSVWLALRASNHQPLTEALFDASCAELVIGDAVAFDATSRELIIGIVQKHSSTSRRVRADKLLLAAGPWTSTVAESLRISR